jgi:riboflavin synthase
MFSGITETMGSIKEIIAEAGCQHFIIQPMLRFDDLRTGDSIAVNGVCLTVTRFDTDTFNVTAVPETLRLTNLKHLEIGDHVNLERSVTMSTRIGGHYVQGHVDGTGHILDISHDNGAALLVKIGVPATLARYIVPKGYIGIDGMSITVITATSEWFTVTFIPHTQQVTTVQNYNIGDEVNIEVDIMAKYIEKLTATQTRTI